jgi:hypothetical protein
LLRLPFSIVLPHNFTQLRPFCIVCFGLFKMPGLLLSVGYSSPPCTMLAALIPLDLLPSSNTFFTPSLNDIHT